MNTDHRKRRVNERYRWVCDSVQELLSDEEVEVIQPIEIEEIPTREEYGVWFLMTDQKPDDETYKKVLSYLMSFSDPLLICRSHEDLIVLPVAVNEKGLGDASQSLAAFMKEAGWPGLLVQGCGYEDLNDVYKAYRAAYESWQTGHVIYPEQPYLSESEIRYAQMIQVLRKDYRLVREAKEHLEALEELYPNGEPIKFLSCYFLDCHMDLNETAARMFLHKNTLKYRRQKINALLGYPIEDSREALPLAVYLAIWRVEKATETVPDG